MAVYPELRQKGLDFEKIIEASRVFPKPQLLTFKDKVTASEVGDQWNGPDLQKMDPAHPDVNTSQQNSGPKSS